MEEILNVRAFLRWAGVNVLIGSWDNYFATPSNYFLYNSRRRGDERGFVASPYFTFIPWDYDNSFGIDYFGTRWQDTELVDWPSNTSSTAGEETALGILSYVRMRHDRARTELAALRQDHPAGSSGASFPARLEPVP